MYEINTNADIRNKTFFGEFLVYVFHPETILFKVKGLNRARTLHK